MTMIDAIRLYMEHNTNQFNANKSYAMRDVQDTFQQTGNIFNSVLDGISILDSSLNILNVNFTMQTWYAHKKTICGNKCFGVYHDRTGPCTTCPTLRALNTGVASREVVSYRNEPKNASGWHDVQAFPVIDDRRIVGVVEYVKDITCEMDLYARLVSLQQDMERMKEQNQLLRKFVQQKEAEKQVIEKTISLNVQKYIKPVMNQIRTLFVDKSMEAGMMSLVDSLFDNIIAPHLDGTAGLDDFTSREIQIMAMIRDGRTTKEIAESLCLSCKTIDFHRGNIRKKLGDRLGERNLRAYLLGSGLALGDTPPK